jgi:CCR4-NOT transcription complex subunit 3
VRPDPTAHNYATTAEIDRCMKKVDEGVELFDEIWEKVYSAEQQNQKEKYEMDLKKEIKKLQRQRDQIKTWISSSEVKDKDPLVDARKLIESKMEQFKICEKETKTKTYSKEGLARADKLDPEEEAKLNTATWISEYIDRFKQQVEEKEFDLDKLNAKGKSKANKQQVEAMQQHIANHKFHVQKLEGIIRLVNNDRLDCETVDALREDLDYYLDSYQDEEYISAYDEDYFYESLGLEDMELINVNNVANASVSGSAKKPDDATSTSSRDGGKKSTKASLSSVIPLTIGRARSKQETEKAAAAAAAAAAAVVETKATPTKAPARSASGGSQKSDNVLLAPPAAASINKAVAPAALAPTPLALSPQTASQQPGTSMAAILKRESEQQEKERQAKVRLICCGCLVGLMKLTHIFASCIFSLSRFSLVL